MKRIFTTPMALALMAGAAHAGNLTEPTPEPTIAPVPVAAPTPDWSGFYAGAQLGYGDGSLDPGADIDGTFAGLHAGYLADLGNWVLGGEVDYDLGQLDVGDAGAELDEIIRLKALAGYDLGNTLLYGTAGGVQANVSDAGVDTDDNGTFIGAGVKQRFGANWVGGAELLYHEFGDFGGTAGADVDLTSLSARLSYQF